MNENMKNGLLGGIINFSLVLVNILVVTVMWQMAGVPYNGAFSVGVFCALLGTLIAAYYHLAVVVAPSIILNSFLCYDLVISQGFAWQEVMSLPLLAGLAIVLLTLSGKYVMVVEALPKYLEAFIPVTLGVFLIYRGLIMSHMVIASPVQITAMGSFYDQLLWVSLPSLLIILALLFRRREYSLLMGLIAAVSLAFFYGLISLPEHLFSLPEGILTTGLQFCFNELFRLAGPFLVVLLVLLVEGLTLGKAVKNNGEKILLTNGIASVLGGLFSGGVMTVAEATVACRFDSKNPIPPAIVSVCLLVMLLFCAPLAMELVKFPVITGAVVIGAGCCMLIDLKFLPINDNISILAGLFTVILVPVWGSLTAGIGFGLIIYSLLMACNGRGRELPGLLYPILGLFVVYFMCNI
ncbi:MAG: hypothetical protein J6M33_06775 [Anaerovibrio sp.]|nr:hypothetical protein [Anaerovibrio sp.]